MEAIRNNVMRMFSITIEDVLSCGKGSTALFMLADCREFYKYEMKEQLDPEPNETEI